MADDPTLTGLLSPSLRDWLARPLAGEADPDVLVLAGVLCTPPIVPYRLLRRMRRGVLRRPGTLGVEGALCSAWFVESLGADGFVFEPEFAHVLRARLRQGLVGQGLAADRDALRRVIDEETAPLSPLLRIEERLCWAYAAEADFARAVDKSLTDVVHTIVQERRPQILTWASGAFSRLPPEVVAGPAAWVLVQLCGAFGLPHPPVEWPDGGVDETLLRTALALVPDALLGLSRNGETLEIGTVTARRRTALAVPAVTPKLLTVEHGSQADQVAIDTSTGPARIAVGHAAVTIRDMRGRAYRLAAFPGDAAPEDVAIDDALAELDRRWRTRQEMDVTVARATDRGSGLIVSFADFPGFTAFLPISRSRLARYSKGLQDLVGSRIRVRVINLDRRQQRVIVERVRRPWSTGSLAPGDEFEGRVTSRAKMGIFVSFGAAAGLGEGAPDEMSAEGLVHRSELSWSRPWTDAREFPVQVGDTMRVRVLDIDAEQQRVALSRKQTMPDPWTAVVQNLDVGNRISVTVNKVVPFGWFLEAVEGIDGLLHISEAPEGSAFEVGAQLTVWVLAIEAERRRLSFTLRPPPW